MPFGIGPLELVIVLVIVLLIFGPKRLPGMGRSLGQGMREFKDSITGSAKDDDDEQPKLNAPAAESQAGDQAPAGEQRVQAGAPGSQEDPFGRG